MLLNALVLLVPSINFYVKLFEEARTFVAKSGRNVENGGGSRLW